MGNPFLFDCYWFGSTFVKVDKVDLAQPLLKVDFTIGADSMRFARHIATTSASNVLGITTTNKMGGNKGNKMGDNKDNKMDNQCGRRPD